MMQTNMVEQINMNNNMNFGNNINFYQNQQFQNNPMMVNNLNNMNQVAFIQNTGMNQMIINQAGIPMGDADAISVNSFNSSKR